MTVTYPVERWCVCGHRDTYHARNKPGRLIWCGVFANNEKCPCKRFLVRTDAAVLPDSPEEE